MICTERIFLDVLGLFLGCEKGHCVFQQSALVKLTLESYCEYILPVVVTG